VHNLAKNDIYVILDFHQDLWHRKFCGEGVPDYVYETCKNSEPAGTKAFPLPSVNASYPLDSDGNPAIESCLSEMFAVYYLSEEVGAGFQCLYDNVNNLWDDFANYWVTIAKKFASTENVLGYELINEPWAGNVYDSPKNLLPQYAERQFLEPLYQHVHNAIRKIDDQKIIFFEGLTIDYWPNGFDNAPGDASYNDRQVLAYHIYCPTDGSSKKLLMACDAIDDLFFAMRRKDADRLGIGMIMTEFGASEDIKTDLYLLDKLADLSDKFQQSWMYWQFKYYEDLTTCTPVGESLYNADGSVNQHKLTVLSRAYPQATAGKIDSYSYHLETRAFHFTYKPLDSAAFSLKENNAVARTTTVYLNHEMSYPNGFHLKVKIGDKEISGSSSSLNEDGMNFSCPMGKQKNYLSLVQTKGLDLQENEFVEIRIEPCQQFIPGVCSCK
jgi:endoglycosylceramidase